MLTVLVQPDADIGHEGHVVRLQSWPQIGRFFRENRKLLSDPQRVQAAARGEKELLLPRVD